MRTGKVLCVLLTVGACCAFPQYGPPKQDEEQQVAVVAEPLGPVGAPIPEQQKEQLGEFWWQNQGVFTGESPGGTVVVVQEPNPQLQGQIHDELATSPFIPSPSPDCDEYHGCIPWQFCVDGVFTNTGEGLLALRTPSKVPETYTQKLCGQIGNICCLIPEPILAAQQQGQSGGAGPYSGSGAGLPLPANGALPQGGTIPVGGALPVGGILPAAGILDALKPSIIEVISSGEVVKPATVIDETDGSYNTGVGVAVPGVAGPGVAGLGVAGPGVAGPGIAGPGVAGPDVAGFGVEQVSSGAGSLVDPAIGGTVPVVEQISGGAGGGAREDIDQQAVGSGGIVEITDTGCPAYTHDCVPYFQCIDGEINTSGAGLIDVRINPQKECTNSEYPEVPGICCKIPGAATPLPINPTPAPIKDCPGNNVCVADSQCNYDGTVNTDGTGLINTRLRNTCYLSYVDVDNYETGVCCQPPVPVAPAPLVTCPGTQVCVAQGLCLNQAAVEADNYNAPAVTSCYYSPDQALVGECCHPPPVPVVHEPLDPCPGTEECVEQYQCNSDGTINTDGAGLINTRVYIKPCYIDTVNHAKGVCCKPPVPAVPEPLVTCPINQVCVSTDQCTSQTALGAASGSSYTPCVQNSASYATGVCCESQTRLVLTCPGASVCIPDILCQGEILTNTDQYKPYGTTGDWTWSQCHISGDVGSPGVCCRNPEPVEPSSPAYPETPVAPLNPYTVSDRCGERNYGLDLRSQVKLAKNEAQFGEFPWQAIIFFTNYTFKCGASLVEDKWLITAAHCVDGYKYGDFRVRLGEWQVDKYDEPFKYVDADIASVTIHPDFKPGPVHNDIALIELAAPVTLQYHINKVCLPSLGQKPAPGTRCFASGWGKDAFEGNYQAILKKVDVPYVDHEYCQNLLQKTRLGKYFVLDKSFMCAGGEENIDACEGDGGGPLVCKDEVTGTYYLAGITAWGIDCGQKDVPGVYADVQLFNPWIESIIYGQAGEQFEQQVSSGAYGRK